MILWMWMVMHLNAAGEAPGEEQHVEETALQEKLAPEQEERALEQEQQNHWKQAKAQC